ncbi:glycosyltransferase family 87 protein [Nocardioides sp.]|uniref:glycosyltransferase family 87 protein n=1 Tax=Nocardioides sp. TaxID=35761 RepID=UPI0039E4EAB3
MAKVVGVQPTREDPAIAALSETVGGPAGGHAGRHPWWTPLRVLLLITAITFAAGMVQKSGCFKETWSGNESRYVQMCYSDLPYLYTGRGFAELAWPYTDDTQTRDRYDVMEYPVGISYWAYGTAWVTHWLAGSPPLDPRYEATPDALWGVPGVQHEVRLFVVVNAVGFAALALLASWLLVRARPSRPWDVATFAAAPTLLFTGLINWDMLAVACVAGALFAWSRGRPGWTGVLIGLGTAVKLYPLYLLGAVLVLCWRRRAWPQFGTAVLGAAVTWVVVNAPAYLGNPDAWKVFWSFNSQRTSDLGSIWLVLSQSLDLTITAHTINAWSWAFFATWCLGVLLVGLLARRTPTLAELGFLIVAGFLLVNKVYSPQYVLWLLPLAVLARPRWRDQFIWQGCELFYFAAVWWYLGGFLASPGGEAPVYWIAIVVRLVGELYLVAVIVRSLLWPAGATESSPSRTSSSCSGR